MGESHPRCAKESWVYCGGNDKKELVQTRLPMKIRVCIDYRKLNSATC